MTTTHSLPAAAANVVQRCRCICFDAHSALLSRDVLYPEHNLLRLYQVVALDDAMPDALRAMGERSFIAGRLEAERRFLRGLDHKATEPDAALVQIWTMALPSIGEQKSIASNLAAAELDIERTSLRVDAQSRHIFDQARCLGKTLVAVNRSWVPSSIFSSWLDALGIPVDHVVCFWGDHPTFDRDQFAACCGDSALHPEDVLYVRGENANEFAGPPVPGMAQLVVPDTRSRIMGPRQRHWDTLPLACSQALALAVNSRIATPTTASPDEALLARLGRSAIGPALGGFTAWIGHIADRAGVDRVVFTSRDGWLPFQVAGDMAWSNQHHLCYGHFSRRALYIPSFAGGLNAEDIKLLTGGLWPSSVGQLLRRCGLSPMEHTRAIESAGFSGTDALVKDENERQRMGELFRRLEPYVRAVGARELEQLSAYLENIGIAGAKRLLFVDIGWRGTLQRGLQRCLRLIGKQTDVIGAYLAILWTPIACDGLSALGWLCDEARDLRTHDVISHSIPVFEACFQANQPSVKGYKDGVPAFGSNAKSRDLCDPLQNAALEYCRDALPLLDAGAKHRIMGQPLLHLAATPSPHEAALIGRYIYADGFGDTDEERPLFRIPKRLRNRSDLQSLRNELDISSWKPGFNAILAERGWLETVYDAVHPHPKAEQRRPRGSQ